MSRWLTNYKNHPFQNNWVEIKEVLKGVNVDDQTILTDVQELARLKKVIVYIDEIQSGLDPELVPKSTWSSFQQQLEPCLQQLLLYKNSKLISHLNQANDHADNLLSYVKPYFTTHENIISALKLGANAYEAQFTDYAESFKNRSDSLIKTIESNQSSTTEYLKQVEKISKKIGGLSDRLFEEKDGVKGIEAMVDKLVAQLKQQAVDVTQLHSELLLGDASKKVLIEKVEKEVTASQKIILEKLSSVKSEVEDLSKFHKVIFGDKESDNNSGLKVEIEKRRKDLIALDAESKEKIDALFKSIEDLLPGATSVGLASAYKELKDKFDSSIKNYTLAFALALFLLILVPIVLSGATSEFFPVFPSKFNEMQQWDEILKAFIYKIPFMLPIIWFAIFSSKRRSQYERLHQEYAHKEAFAKSYESYKKQLTELNIDTNDLQKALIEKAIQAISYNASVTLDGKHEDLTPLTQVFEKVTPDDIKAFFEFTRKASK
jgi:hypothetical protein